jgi:hypothetical protein
MIDFIIKNIGIAFFIGWGFFLIKWNTDLKPQRVRTMTSKIYNEIEELYFQSLPKFFSQLMIANKKMLNQRGSTLEILEEALSTKFNENLNTIYSIRIQRDLIFKLALKRRLTLFSMWLFLVVSIFIIPYSISFEINNQSIGFKIANIMWLLFLFGSLFIHIGSFWYVWHQNPILDDKYNALIEVKSEFHE